MFGDVSNGNYLVCMKTRVDKYGKAGKGTPSFLSLNVCEEIRQLMGQKVLGEAISRVKFAKYCISQWVNVDSTADITHVEQLTITLRYVPPDGCTEERFVKEQNQPFR